MKSGLDFYNLFRSDRPYLPEWSELTDREKSRFEKMAKESDGLLGMIYKRIKYGEPKPFNKNPCGEIFMTRIVG